jgi:hypothetical protein
MRRIVGGGPPAARDRALSDTTAPATGARVPASTTTPLIAADASVAVCCRAAGAAARPSAALGAGLSNPAKVQNALARSTAPTGTARRWAAGTTERARLSVVIVLHLEIGSPASSGEARG